MLQFNLPAIFQKFNKKRHQILFLALAVFEMVFHLKRLKGKTVLIAVDNANFLKSLKCSFRRFSKLTKMNTFTYF